jgi:hypothetical protein
MTDQQLKDKFGANQSSYTFYVIGEENGCYTQQPVSFAVRQKPNVTIAGKHIYCVGDNINLTAIAESNNAAADKTVYFWSNGEEKTGDGTFSTTATTAISQIKVTATDEFSCVNEATHDIEVKIAPQISVSAEKTDVCQDESAKITASITPVDNGNATSFSWSKENAPDFTSTDATIQPSMSNTGEGTHKFTVTGSEVHKSTTFTGESATCSTAAEIVINERPNPVVGITGATNVCPDNTVNLSAKNAKDGVIVEGWEWYKGSIADDNKLNKNNSFITTDKITQNTTFFAEATTNYQ